MLLVSLKSGSGLSVRSFVWAETKLIVGKGGNSGNLREVTSSDLGHLMKQLHLIF